MLKTTKYLILTGIFVVSFLAWGAVRIISGVNFDYGCGAYIKHAADANTIEIAAEELSKAITYAENHGWTKGTASIFFRNPESDIGFWYNNLCSAQEELLNVPKDYTQLERTNVLMNLRETLLDRNGKGMYVTYPSGIEVYPYNALYFWWAIISIVLIAIFGFKFAIYLTK